MDSPDKGSMEAGDATPVIESISAVTLATRDMPRAVNFYLSLGFERLFTTEILTFTSFNVGGGHLNLVLVTDPHPRERTWWGRIIFYVSDVDALYRHALSRGLSPDTAPRDAEWEERYFHISDPDGHELSFAKPHA